MGAFKENILKFPDSTLYGKEVPKTVFIKQVKDHKESFRKFMTDEFESITWLYKLHSSTLNVLDSSPLDEIDVFYCQMKRDFYSINPFCGLDRLIHHRTMFIIKYGESIDILMHHKEAVKVKGVTQWNMGTTELSRNVDMGALDIKLDGNTMDLVYNSLLGQISGLKTRSIVDYKTASEIRAKIKALDKKIDSLNNKIRAEKQFNIQIELRAFLKEAETEREKLNLELQHIAEG